MDRHNDTVSCDNMNKEKVLGTHPGYTLGPRISLLLAIEVWSWVLQAVQN